MKDFNLYIIIDTDFSLSRNIFDIAIQAIKGGADVIQLRGKKLTAKELIETGRQIKEITHQRGVTFIINDRVDVAFALGADGVHLGQGDIPIDVARRILGQNKFIGVSTHDLEQALDAQREGADYISIGPIFKTPTKPDCTPVGLKLLEEVKGEIKIPYVAIGGIDKENIGEIIKRGVKRIAVVRAVVSSPDIVVATKELKDMLIK